MKNSVVGVAVAVCAFVLPSSAHAQWGLWPADSLLAEGRLARAESAYYAQTRTRPRDPVARAALGRFLAARGGVRAGAVLLEEAQFFGGDSAALARALVPLYERLRDYRMLAELKPDVLSAVERRRAVWLARRPSEARLRDTVVLLTYRPLGDGRGFGTVMLRIGRSEYAAVIDPRVTGLVLPAVARRDVRVFGNHGGRTIAVADSMRIGSVMFSNVPASIGSPDEAARVGFDVIAPYYPGFDPSKNILTLRRVQRRSPSPAGSRVPALYTDDGMRLLLGDKWQATTSAMPAMLLATRKWIWDWKLGDVVLSNP
ncbi:MAG TPA: hypothetical protein VEB19_17775 [Gemmatimonadaceae bacterium]|nr:hypothetical protein [Gemmatimonadaceae bacterium]